MSQAEALLNTLASDETTVYSRNSETEGHIVIGNDRKIKVPASLKRLAVQHDHNVETVVFDCPRYWDNHDMSTMKVYITYLLPDDTIGSYLAQNVTALGNTMSFTWTITNNVTRIKGDISFLVCIKRTDADGNEDLHWNSELNTECYVSEGIEGAVSIVAKYPDIVTQLLTRMDEVEAIATIEAMQSYTDTWLEENHDRVLAEIAAKGAATLATIPEDYTTTYNAAIDAVRTKAAAIVCEAEGETIVVNDSSDDLVRGLKVFGKSTQGGTPTPDNPVEIVSVESPAVNVCGKNLLENKANTKTENGITFSINDDKSITINGISTATPLLVINTSSPIYYQGLQLIASLGCDNEAVHMAVGYSEENGDYVDSLVMISAAEDTFVYPTNAAKMRIYIFVSSNVQFKDVTVYPMIRLAENTNSTYEPYTVSQSLILNHTLHGIPVTSGGNHTDENGQQWICDEIDLDRGVLIHRVKDVILDGSSDEPWGYNTNVGAQKSGIFTITASNIRQNSIDAIMCENYIHGDKLPINDVEYWGTDSYFGISQVAFRNDEFSDVTSWRAYLTEHPIRIVYGIKTPIETPLTAEEIAAFKALRTNYPNTTVLNDSGAWVKMEYNADTKLYVDNKISAAISAFLAEHQIG